MKAVYSFWGEPFWKGGGGYLSGLHFLSLLGLSIELSKKSFKSVEMHACSKSYNILQDIGWFDKVHKSMEEIEHLPLQHWAVAKLVAFSKQDSPFLHIDNDVLLNKELPKNILVSPVISQCVEKWEDFKGNYSPQINAIEAKEEKPKHWQRDWKSFKPFAFNTGIFGGCDLHFIKEYSTSAIAYMLEYGANLVDVNTTIEQAYLAMCAKSLSEPVTCLLDDWRNNSLAKQYGYVHYWGGTKRDKDKQGVYNLDRIVARLKTEYPETFEKAVEFQKYFDKR